MGARIHQLSVVEELTKFTFYLRCGAWARALGKTVEVWADKYSYASKHGAAGCVLGCFWAVIRCDFGRITRPGQGTPHLSIELAGGYE